MRITETGVEFLSQEQCIEDSTNALFTEFQNALNVAL